MNKILGDVLLLDKNNKIDIVDSDTYKIAGVQNYGKGIVIRRKVFGKELTMKKYQVIKENQLMWCKVDTKNGAFGLTKKEHIGSLASTNMALATIDETKIIPDFLETLFKIKFFHEHITKYSSGSTNRKYLTPKQLFELIEIPNLSLEEQEKFIYKVNTLNNSGLYEEVETQQILLKKLRQSILQEAIEGKLTVTWREQNPDVESASILLEKIKTEKEQLIKEKKIKKQKPLPPINKDEIPFDTPDSWEWCRLRSILDSLIGGNSYLSSLFKEDGINQVLRLGNIRPYKLRLDAKPVFITEELATETLNVELKTNDILISMTGTRGKRDYCYTVLLQENDFKDKKLFLNQRVGCFRFNNNVLPKFYDFVLKNDVILDSIYKTATGSANQANIGSTTLSLWNLPLPPFEEQKEIVRKIENLFKICDELESQINSSKINSQTLMQAVLKEAFENDK